MKAYVTTSCKSKFSIFWGDFTHDSDKSSSKKSVRQQAKKLISNEIINSIN